MSSSVNDRSGKQQMVTILSNLVLKDWETPLPGTHRHMDEVQTTREGLLTSADIVTAVKESHGVEGKLVVRYYHPEWMAWGRLPEGMIKPDRKESGELWLEVRVQVQDLPSSSSLSQVSTPDKKTDGEADSLDVRGASPEAKGRATPSPPAGASLVASSPVLPSPIPSSSGSSSAGPSGPAGTDPSPPSKAEPSKSQASAHATASSAGGARPATNPAEFANFVGMESEGGIDLPWVVVEWSYGNAVGPSERRDERTVSGKWSFCQMYNNLYIDALAWLHSEDEHPANEMVFGIERNVTVTPDKLAVRLPGLSEYLAPDNGLDRFVLFLAASRECFSNKGATRVNGRWKPKTNDWCGSPECPDLAFLDHKWTDEPGLDWNENWNSYMHLIVAENDVKNPSCDCLAALRFVRTQRRAPAFPRGLVRNVVVQEEASALVGFRTLSDALKPSNTEPPVRISDTQSEATSTSMEDGGGEYSEQGSMQQSEAAQSEMSQSDFQPSEPPGTPAGFMSETDTDGSLVFRRPSNGGRAAEQRHQPPSPQAEIRVPRLPSGLVDWEHPRTQAVLGEILTALAEGEKVVTNGGGPNLEALLAAVDKLPPFIRFLASLPEQKPIEGLLRHLQAVLSNGLQILHTEFVQVLEVSSAPPKEPINLRVDLERQIQALRNAAPNAPVKWSIPEMPDGQAVQTLHALVTRLVMPEWKPKHGISFKDRRREALLRNLQRLEVGKVSAEDVAQMSWVVLEAHMKAWVDQIRTTVHILFVAERKLCDEVLAGLDPFPDRCFCESAGICLSTLVDQGATLATSKKTPEKLIVLLDMYRTTVDLQPVVNALFRNSAGARYRQLVGGLVRMLASAVKETAQTFEQIVESEAAADEGETWRGRQKKDLKRSPSTVVDADVAQEVAVQGLTSYVVNYIRLLASRHEHYVKTLTEICADLPPPESPASFLQPGGLPSLFLRIMRSLDHNLLTKAKQQRDVHLQEVFMLNNVYYIIQKIGSCDAAEILGPDWMKKHQMELDKRKEFYISLLLAKVEAQVFKPEPGDAKAAITRLRLFNADFDALRQNKSYQLLTDGPVQSYVCSEILRRVSTGYRKFIENHRAIVGSSKTVSKFYIHTPEDVDMKLRLSFISPA